MTPAGKISLTLFGKIKMTPENDYCFRGFLGFVIQLFSLILARTINPLKAKYNKIRKE